MHEHLKFKPNTYLTQITYTLHTSLNQHNVKFYYIINNKLYSEIMCNNSKVYNVSINYYYYELLS